MTDWPELRINIGCISHRASLDELKRRAHGDASIAVSASVAACGQQISTSQIPDGSSVGVFGSVDATMSGVELRASVSASWEGECRRCLDLVSGPLEIELDVPFLFDLDGDDEGDAYPIDGETIDVGEVVRESLMLALPLSPLCSDDCEGADPERFPTDGTVADDDSDGAIDPRWAGLSALTFDED